MRNAFTGLVFAAATLAVIATGAPPKSALADLRPVPDTVDAPLASSPSALTSPAVPDPSLLRPGEERWFANPRQLTRGGQNAEAYFSFSGKRICFQSTRDGYPCDQIYIMNPDGTNVQRISNGTGRTTCSFIYPGDRDILFASTHLVSPDCPPPPPADSSLGYVWSLYDYDIFRMHIGSSLYHRITTHPGYDAEGCLTPDGETLVYTSLANGDLDIYSLTADGDAKRLTDDYGFDGGPFVSWDGKLIVYRGYHPHGEKAVSEYRQLIGRRLMKPVQAEIYLMNLDGSGKRQLTSNGAANWAPAFHPNGRQIIFSSNLAAPGTPKFDLYVMNLDGSDIQRVTQGGFNSFPYFSPDGKTLLFCSDRNAKQPHEFNVFAVDWTGSAVDSTAPGAK